jgi:hypothetical protein
MVSQRKIIYMLLLSALAFTLYIASFYEMISFDAIRYSPTEVLVTTTVTVFSQETATRPAGSQHEVNEPLQTHLFRSDGLLEVNTNGRHPIYDLIERADAEWDMKMSRQSKTLLEAVAEYERRYRRAPPKGFDEWYVHISCTDMYHFDTTIRWSYREHHNVRLPDEYDRIYHDLEPFWGMDPVDLNKLLAEREISGDTFILSKTGDSNITVVASVFPENDPDIPEAFHITLAKSIAHKMNKISRFIPPFRAMYSIYDNPNLTTDWELKAQALQAAAARTCIYIALS